MKEKERSSNVREPERVKKSRSKGPRRISRGGAIPHMNPLDVSVSAESGKLAEAVSERRSARTHNDTNYILIGMPASGKSSLGQMLARLLERDFIDTDDVLKEYTGNGPGDLLACSSFAAFVRREEAAVCTLACKNTVIATGGSVVYSPIAMQHLKEMGTLIYLSDSYRNICRRVGPLDKRGVIGRPGQSFYDIYLERCKLYEHYADISFSSERFMPRVSVKYLAAVLKFLEIDGSEQGRTAGS